MASVSLRKKSGRYYARFYDKSRQPKRKEVSLGTSRKSVARPEMRKREQAYAEGKYDPWGSGWLVSDKVLSNAADAFIQSKKAAGLRPNTISVYHYVLKGLV